MPSYYNENDPFAAAWLRELINAGLIADGEVDERSIELVQADDVRGFAQCHFFAGIGGWSYALRLGGWPDERAVWTFSCPCQKLSSATRGRAVAADLWPEQRRLIAANRPGVFFGEQVPNRQWFDRLCADVEILDYAIGAAVLPAVVVGADHARLRTYFVGHTDRNSQSGLSVNGEAPRMPRHSSHAERVVSPHGVSRDVVALSGFGNAIVPELAAQFIGAYLAVGSSASE